MAKSYYRPLGFVYGPDAERLISQRRAGCLAGYDGLGFTQIEVINRSKACISREIIPYKDVSASVLEPLEQSRGHFAGLDMSQSSIMGIINVTPDSFSDGGKFHLAEAAVAQGKLLQEEGAHLLDIGGESTRPGAETVPDDEEAARVLPVISALAASGKLVSVDTRKAAVMVAAAQVGAQIINDVSALTYDQLSLEVVAKSGLPVILMHAQGDPRTMQLNPQYDDVALDVYDYLEVRIAAAVTAGIPLSKIAIDPGIGFGKSFDHNLALLQQISLFHGLGVPILLGISRKGFIGALTGEKQAANRIYGSVGGAVAAALQGVQILRVHDVKATVQALSVARAILASRAA